MTFRLTGYSKSPKNIYHFTDGQISSLYELVNKNMAGDIGYLAFFPVSNEDHNNPNFLRDSVVDITNKYFETFLKKPNHSDNDYKTAKKKELQKNILIAKEALENISLLIGELL